MQSFRRSLVTLGVAAMLPTLVFAAVGTFFLLRAERQQIEGATLRSSQILMSLVDARLRGELAALRTLAATLEPQSQAWDQPYASMLRVQASNPHWLTIALFDAASGARVLDLRHPLGRQQISRGLDPADLAKLEAQREPLVSGVQNETVPLIYLYVPFERAGHPYVLAAALRPEEFQELLLAQVRDTTAAIVDSDGRFVGRTVNYQERVGKPATIYVRTAIREGRQGVYRGYTYEGMKNYTAYASSSWTGWSAHIAIASSLIDTPTSWSIAVATLAGLGSAVLAVFLVTLVLRDMAERRQAEEALRQSQKMEAVGQLTGGIAHDFNNLLTALMGNLDLLQTRAANDARLQRLASNAMEAARRGAKLASQLLVFSRSQRIELAAVDLRKLLSDMGGLLSQSVGPSISIRVDLDPQAHVVRSDVNQLELALLNIAVNARDAMPKGGCLQITSRWADARHLAEAGREPGGRYVEIRISDDGQGMSEDVRRRALEPFFTTKPVGQGTGLGLSQVYAVMRESAGSVRLESAPMRGTTVCLYLPAATLEPEPAASPPPARVVPISARSRPRAHILLVDDDEQVRGFMADSLQALGYAVTDSAEPAAALHLLESQRFDLLVADFAMPGMNGAALARALQERQADLKVLIVSGHAESAALEATLGSGHFLRKPFDVGQLAEAVAETLVQSPPLVARPEA